MSAGPFILFAGGGTGGHLFPGLAIAEQVVRECGDARIKFLCSARPGDAEMLGAERLLGKPVEFQAVAAQPFAVRPRAFLKFVASWGGAVRGMRAEIAGARKTGREVVLVAMGGFVAAPAVQAARVERCPVLMVNLDAAPGRANRWISRHAKWVYTAAEVSERAWIPVRPIVRAAARAPGDAATCREMLGLDRDRPTLLVTGASLGASSINRFLCGLVRAKGEDLCRGGWQVVHQTGKSDIEETRKAYKSARLPARVEPFYRDMGVAWGAADMAISRAGAGSVAEAWCNAVPTVFMPYPFHADQHQRRNAEPLVSKGAAVLANDEIDGTKNVQSNGETVLSLMRDANARAAMRAALRGLGPADGAETIASRLVRGMR